MVQIPSPGDQARIRENRLFTSSPTPEPRPPPSPPLPPAPVRLAAPPVPPSLDGLPPRHRCLLRCHYTPPPRPRGPPTSQPTFRIPTRKHSAAGGARNIYFFLQQDTDLITLGGVQRRTIREADRMGWSHVNQGLRTKDAPRTTNPCRRLSGNPCGRSEVAGKPNQRAGDTQSEQFCADVGKKDEAWRTKTPSKRRLRVRPRGLLHFRAAEGLSFPQRSKKRQNPLTASTDCQSSTHHHSRNQVESSPASTIGSWRLKAEKCDRTYVRGHRPTENRHPKA